MFTSKKNLRLIDYQDSYYYRQQRKKQRAKVLKYTLFIIVFLTISTVCVQAFANTSENLINRENTLVKGPQILFNHPDPNLNIALPIDIDAKINISGLIAYTEITQVFINPHAVALEGKYQFPLPEDSAMQHLSIKVGDKEIVGQIMEKKKAKSVYQKAKSQGKKASLVEQQRANIFSNKIANIPANSRVSVTIKFVMPVAYSNATFSLRLPLAITERYTPKTFENSPAEHSVMLTLPKASILAPSQASMNIALNAGVAVESIHSTSHKINTAEQGTTQSEYLITLNKKQTPANRDFQLSWRLLKSNKAQISSFTEQINDEYFTLLTFFPPQEQAKNTFARDIIFIIDTSGSMQGEAIAQAKLSLEQALLQLGKQDSFNIIAFESSSYNLFGSTQMVTDSSISRAKEFINALSADGGTEMYHPLSNALVMKKSPHQSPQAIRQLVFITDGAVANEFELMKLLNNSPNNFRLNTVGIGSAPNGYFMKKAAQFGRGSYVFIQNTNDVADKMSELIAKISQPTIKDIQLLFDNQANKNLEVFPQKIPDLHVGEPLQIAIKSQLPIDSLQLMGSTNTENWYHQLIINDNASSPGISSLWARRKIEDLLDSLVLGANKEEVKKNVIKTSIAHQIISPYTSFIAVEKQPKLDTMLAEQQKKKAEQKMKKLMQAHESLLVAMPKTALGWQQQFLFGALLLIIAAFSNLLWRQHHAKIHN